MTDDKKSPTESTQKTDGKKSSSKVAIAAGAIGSAAIAAALLYAGKRSKQKKNESTQPGPIPSGENPETD